MTYNRISVTPILVRAAGALVLGAAAVGGIFRQADLVIVKVADKASPLLTLNGWPLY